MRWATAEPLTAPPRDIVWPSPAKWDTEQMSTRRFRQHRAKLGMALHKYTVMGSAHQRRIVAVVDAEGRCHLGRALATVPSPDAQLHGDPPIAGIRRLYTAGNHVPCPLVLLVMDCQPEVAAKLVAPINLL